MTGWRGPPRRVARHDRKIIDDHDMSSSGFCAKSDCAPSLFPFGSKGAMSDKVLRVGAGPGAVDAARRERNSRVAPSRRNT